MVRRTMKRRIVKKRGFPFKAYNYKNFGCKTIRKKGCAFTPTKNFTCYKYLKYTKDKKGQEDIITLTNKKTRQTRRLRTPAIKMGDLSPNPNQPWFNCPHKM